MKVHNIDYPDFKTVRQWAKQGFLPTADAKGIELWSNRNCQNRFIYYSPDEVAKATVEELTEFFRPERERKREQARKYRENKKLQKKRDAEREAYLQQIMREQELTEPLYARIKELNRTISKLSTELGKPNIGDRILILDTETTGLDCTEDEILQLSIIDIDGNEVFNSYFKPFAKSWSEAQKVNHITPEMVADAPRLSDKANEINMIFAETSTIIGYNTYFDLNFLKSNGIVIPNDSKIVDVMTEFAVVYGEFSEKYGSYKWQKLTTAASYYDYDWNSHGEAHDSLSDCYATLHVYNSMKIETKKEE